jgi:hypothetical protein
VSEELDLELAPGCFAGALTFNPKAGECRSCEFFHECAPRAYAALCDLRKALGKKPPPPYSPPGVDVETAIAAPTALAVPRKIDNYLVTWEKKDLQICPALKAGVNPFTGKTQRWMAIACHLLLRDKNGISREQLALAFKTKLDWTQETATAHARYAAQALTACGAATETNGRLTLR